MGFSIWGHPLHFLMLIPPCKLVGRGGPPTFVGGTGWVVLPRISSSLSGLGIRGYNWVIPLSRDFFFTPFRELPTGCYFFSQDYGFQRLGISLHFLITVPSLQTCREGWAPDFVGGTGWVGKFLSAAPLREIIFKYCINISEYCIFSPTGLSHIILIIGNPAY
jgi:hypothetical protein